ncbi:hypothetical protein BKA70DRAFT_1444489 [Coprinopsis sp. MPI-PUGE-AT-0042]|nr:hypothetical protein BKA70DRAFT_1444489 [Coprinopsis sp. MPI-PUGE-AT-0042]
MKELKRRQMAADAAKVENARKRQQATREKQQQQRAELVETSKSLVLEDEAIDKLTVPQLDKQLDFHRANPVPAPRKEDVITIPARTTIGNKGAKAELLKRVAKRYLEHLELSASMDVEEEEEWEGISGRDRN